MHSSLWLQSPWEEDDSGPVASCASAHMGVRGHVQSTPGVQREETSKESPEDDETMLSQDPALPAGFLLSGSTMLLEPRLWGLWLLLPPGLPSQAVQTASPTSWGSRLSPDSRFLVFRLQPPPGSPSLWATQKTSFLVGREISVQQESGSVPQALTQFPLCLWALIPKDRSSCSPA